MLETKRLEGIFVGVPDFDIVASIRLLHGLTCYIESSHERKTQAFLMPVLFTWSVSLPLVVNGVITQLASL